MNRKTAVIPILFFAALFIFFPPTLLAQTVPRPDSLRTDSDSLRTAVSDTSRATLSDTLKNVPPDTSLGRTAPKDTATFFYKQVPYSSPFFSTLNRIADSTRDYLFHRQVEDYFDGSPHLYLRDKYEFGQANELVVGGLGVRHQVLLLDDALLNDPISMTAVYGNLSTESFADLSLYSGTAPHLYSPAPVVMESRTQNFVAAKGYTKLHYFQYRAGALKTDGTFSLNLSDRLNFYGGYARESSDGTYSSATSNTGAKASASEANKFRARLRYQLARRTWLTLSEYYNVLKVQPFGGVDIAATRRFGLNPFGEVSSITQNQESRSIRYVNLLKADIELGLPFVQQADSTSLFRAWMYLENFHREYEKPSTTSNLLDSAAIYDEENSLRFSFGGSQGLTLAFFSLGLRANFYTDAVGKNNTLANADGDNIRPLANTLDLNGGIKLRFENLVFGQALEGAASLGLSTKVITNTGGLDNTSAFLYGGAGGEVNFPVFFIDSSRAQAFATVSNTQRVPSLQEVFFQTLGSPAQSAVQGSLTWKNESINRVEIGGLIALGKSFTARASLLTQFVLSPVMLVQEPASDTSLALTRFVSLTNERMTYAALGISLTGKVWQLETTVSGTYLLDYALLKNPDAAFTEGVQAGKYSDDLRSSQTLYLPKLSLHYSLFYRGKLLDDKLELKAGISGWFNTSASASLRINERAELFYPNFLQASAEAGGVRDNNVQFGTSGAGGSLNGFLWARLGSAVITLTWENIADTEFFRAPLFPVTPRFIRFGFSWEILN